MMYSMNCPFHTLNVHANEIDNTDISKGEAEKHYMIFTAYSNVKVLKILF